MDERKVICPDCGCENEVFGNGFYGTWQCCRCGNWFNAFGQSVIPPEEQVLCDDW